MSPSRLAFANFWRASAPCCDARRPDARCLAGMRNAADASLVVGSWSGALGVSRTPTAAQPRAPAAGHPRARGYLRPQHRRPDPTIAAQAGNRSERTAYHSNRARRRLCVRPTGRARLIFHITAVTLFSNPETLL